MVTIVIGTTKTGAMQMQTEPMTAPTEDITQLNALERWSRALRALARVVADPDQTDQVLVFSSYANAGTMGERTHLFFDDPRGQKLYDEHRTIDSHTVDLDALAALPEGTLGHAYAHFLRSRGLTPEVFDSPPQEIRDPRIQYVVQRVRQTHDLWHVVTGCNTDPAGEVALQAFTFAQVRAPSTAILAIVGTLRGLRGQRALPRDVIAAYRAGRRAEKLAVFPWEDHWATPLEKVRELLHVEARAAA
jgi:ubiquinone biosynthesis protein COQ4